MKQPSDLSESLHQRLNSYAVAASAAGVSLLALAQPAEGRIVYTKAHHVIAHNETYKLDLNHDGTIDFSFSNYFHAQGTNSTGGFVSVIPIKPSNQVQGYPRRSHAYASALMRGVRIDSKRQFLPDKGQMAWSNGVSGLSTGGPWANVKHRYLGLKFQIHGKTHYGWARLNVSCNHPTLTATLTGYAYETIPGKPIIAGKTHGKDVITLQPASLGHLARGASGLTVWRAKEAR